mmetsp:Transcript_6976/g.20504  ORF Transcript_6976/g.20504 Transcript_6976/m.20504 type:complete len:195 (-) Transcript_6976:47-631(-)|eukprot:CAMPEP_0119274054 /NCGR_PEP_ID=MMETSP1329-20130426/11452_1 /TAXON_ID=114041 /ORGANISM="Genus nov. species nov., Strain RCC1024" /LENGTH=194 /DNA_ID=CAMNT_0007274331 /DNA_START=170 /DNA_END=754 /DNA_ORIENTATION=-
MLRLAGVLCLAHALIAPAPRAPRRLRATTSSGIEFEDVVVGEGRSPGVGDFVSVIYETRLNGKRIDATGGGEAKPVMSTGVAGAGNRPWAQFAVGKGKVIKGWDETVQTMKVGGKRTVKLPAALAYGDAGSPDGVVPPGSPLEFTIELTSIESNADVVGITAKTFGFVFGLVALNGVVLQLTGHELREFLSGGV